MAKGRKPRSDLSAHQSSAKAAVKFSVSVEDREMRNQKSDTVEMLTRVIEKRRWARPLRDGA
jgi:hypothetical protein